MMSDTSGIFRLPRPPSCTATSGDGQQHTQVTEATLLHSNIRRRSTTYTGYRGQPPTQQHQDTVNTIHRLPRPPSCTATSGYGHQHTQVTEASLLHSNIRRRSTLYIGCRGHPPAQQHQETAAPLHSNIRRRPPSCTATSADCRPQAQQHQQTVNIIHRLPRPPSCTATSGDGRPPAQQHQETAVLLHSNIRRRPPSCTATSGDGRRPPAQQHQETASLLLHHGAVQLR